MSRPFAFARVVSAGLVAAVVLTMAHSAARANGAFPESYQIVLPVDRPSQIVLATNFGLIISDDGGASWTWTCEQQATQMGSLYSAAAPPVDRFFSLSTLVGLAWSADDSCTWTSSGGSLDTVLASDYFADPTNGQRVYAMGQNPDDATSLPRVFVSDDAGKTFGPDPIFAAPAGLTLSGLESARSDARVIYIAAFTTGFHPRLERSLDGGASWKELDVEPSLGTNNFRIIAVDPDDATALTVRVIETTGESLAISRDGGATFTKLFTIPGQLTGYARLDSQTIFVSGTVGTEGVGYRSTDGGLSFVGWTPRTTDDGGVPDVSEDGGAPRPPHLTALAARGGTLYAAAKNFSDDWALGVSTDQGVTFQRLMRYDQVSAIRPCARAACLDSCEAKAKSQVWPLSVCHATAATGGCGCALGEPRRAGAGALAALCVVAAVLARRSRLRR
jgi:hypothetical protein